MTPNARLLILVAICLWSCSRSGGGKGQAGGDEPAEQLARKHLSSGRADEALAAVAGRDDPEALTIQGRAWILKARSEQRMLEPFDPTRLVVPEPVLSASDATALGLLERAVSVQPDNAEAHLAIAELLEPGALLWHKRRLEVLAATPPRKAAPKPTPSVQLPSPRLGPDRVVQEYRSAAHADRASVSIVEAWLRFAEATGRTEEAEVALQELVARTPRSSASLVRYGDFLRDQRGDTAGALEKYGQALIWSPDDEQIKTRVVDVYLGLADSHLKNREYAAADQRLKDASRYLPSSASSAAQRLEVLREKLSDIRGR